MREFNNLGRKSAGLPVRKGAVFLICLIDFNNSQCVYVCVKETSGEKTNNGIHYRLQLLYSNGKTPTLSHIRFLLNQRDGLQSPVMLR